MSETQPDTITPCRSSDENFPSQLEQQLRLHDEVTHALTASASIEEAYLDVLRSICESLSWDLGVLWLVDRQLDRLRYGNSWHTPAVHVEAFESTYPITTFALDVDLPGRVWRSGLPIWIPDLLNDGDFGRAEPAAAAGLHSALSFPISDHGQVIAVIECFSHDLHQPQAALLETLLAVGDQIGSFVEHREAEEQVRQLNHALNQRVTELQTLLDVLPVGIVVAHDPQCQNMSINPAGAHMLNVPLDANPSKSAPTEGELPFQMLRNGRVVPPEELPIQYAVAHGVPVRDVELDVLHSDGMLLNLLEYASPLYDEHSRVRGALGVFVDITPRKSAERRLAMQFEIARALAESNMVEAASRTLQAICEAMNWKFAALWRVEPETGSVINVGEWHAPATGLAELVEATRQRSLVDEASLPHRVWRSGQPVWSGRLPRADRPARTELADRLGLHDAFAFPIWSGDQVIAVVECLNDHIRQPDPGLVVVFRAIGDQLGIFLERLRIEAELAIQVQQQSILAQAGVVLSTSLDYETCLENMAQLVVPGLADWCAIDMLESDQSLRRLAVAHVDPAKIELAREVSRRLPPKPDDPAGLHHVLRTGQPELYHDIPDALLAATITDPETLELVHELGLSSAMIVPLSTRGRRLGAITLAWAESERHYGPNDLALAEELARRAALAVDNAQLYAQAQRLNAELERRVADRTAQVQAANTRLVEEISERRHAEEQVRRLNVELEQRVAERTTQLESVNRDLQKEIAQRQQTGQTLRALLKRTRELYRISQAIGTVRTPDEVLAVLLSSSYLKAASRASIAVFDQPWRKESEPPAGCGVVAEWNKDASRPRFLGRHFTLIQYGVAPPYAYGQPIVISHMRSYTALPENTRRRFAELGTRGLIILPLVAGGEWYGLLSLHFKSRRAMAVDDLRHVRGLVDEAAIAIHNLRLLDAEAQARREAEQANDLKLKFLAMISHELRTPLTSIKGFATTLLAEDVQWHPANQRDFLETINEESDKLGDLIEQLLDLSRIEAGVLRIAPKQQTLAGIISSAMVQLQLLTAEHKLVLDVPSNLPPVQADGERIAQVLINLVGNAAKYSPPQTTIAITARQADNVLQVDVADQGPGIPAQDRAHVFEAFEQLNHESTRRTGGAGLGLAICRGLIEAHGGRIWAQARPGPGTVISFTLPIGGAQRPLDRRAG